ncbi:MAG: ATP-binding protein [Oscillospiraceae bacterium]|nr:ATP-binding protein [Oscillospiraceae bacterium]
MALDGKVLRRARQRLEDNKRMREAELNRRTLEVYERAPAVKELDRRIRQTAAEAITAAVSGGESAQSAVDSIGEENLALQQEREYEIVMAGFPKDYLDDSYACQKCHDTGFADGGPCDCLMELYSQEQQKELSSLLKMGNESFDNFDLMLYDDKPDPKTGINPRKQMEYVYDYCMEYALKFGKHKYNLFLNGGTGLGKTFLSACIAKVVANSGYSVVYDTAQGVFSEFETCQFSKNEEEVTAAKAETRRILGCDLLIIDDLGTEMTTSFTVSALYEIVNTRLINGKRTVINSNLTLEQMRQRYSPQIMSRLEGEYRRLTFYGEDIRLKKSRG